MDKLTYLFIILLILFIPIIADIKVNLAYKIYSKKKNSKNLTGFDVAKKILDKNNISGIYILKTSGYLTDNFNPSKKAIFLSQDVYDSSSIASIAIAAHECGHVIQHHEGYKWMKIRTSLVPVVNLASNISYFSFLISLITGLYELYLFGVILLIISLSFQLVTLPVEIDASRRARNILLDEGLIDSNEKVGINKMLKAAAMTYIASVISNILYIFTLLASDDRR